MWRTIGMEYTREAVIDAQTIAVLHHIFKYIFIADFGLLIMKNSYILSIFPI